MILVEICRGVYKIFALGDSPNRCQLLDFLDDLESNLQKDGDRVLALLKRVAREGPPKNPDICHQIGNKIYQFSQGRLRVIWFYDEGKMIICTQGFIKKTPRTPQGEISNAKLAMKSYFEAKKSGLIEIIAVEEGE
ncbi:MAG: type II toxin-antitoxin system RelE/ParE family toxin [Proteobacteria bacterium]|nr:type II toxin-antitoxin system RelE/ParE family toxin [Pseudomonadota bacterium]